MQFHYSSSSSKMEYVLCFWKFYHGLACITVAASDANLSISRCFICAGITPVVYIIYLQILIGRAGDGLSSAHWPSKSWLVKKKTFVCWRMTYKWDQSRRKLIMMYSQEIHSRFIKIIQGSVLYVGNCFLIHYITYNNEHAPLCENNRGFCFSRKGN